MGWTGMVDCCEVATMWPVHSDVKGFQQVDIDAGDVLCTLIGR